MRCSPQPPCRVQDEGAKGKGARGFFFSTSSAIGTGARRKVRKAQKVLRMQQTN